MLNAFTYSVARFTAGIERAALIRLKEGGNAHFSDWVCRVIPMNQVQIIMGDGHWEMHTKLLQLGNRFRIQFKPCLKLGNIRYIVF